VCTPFQHRTKLLLVSHNFSNVMINNTSTDEAHYVRRRGCKSRAFFYDASANDVL
jgi:hypothetical protein